MSLDGTLTVENQIQYTEERITSIFNAYRTVKQNQLWTWSNTAITELAAFQKFLSQEGEKKINIDDIKQYVLTMSEKFTDYVPWAFGLEGGSDLKKALKTEANRWPTYGDLLEKEKIKLLEQKAQSLNSQINKLHEEIETLEESELKLVIKVNELKANNHFLVNRNKNIVKSTEAVLKYCQLCLPQETETQSTPVKNNLTPPKDDKLTSRKNSSPC